MDSLRRWAWVAASTAPLLVVTHEHVVGLGVVHDDRRLPVRLASGSDLEDGQPRVVLMRRRLTLASRPAEVGDVVELRSPVRIGERQWLRVAAQSNQFVLSSRGAFEVVPRASLWLEADDNGDPPYEDDSADFGPVHQSLVEGVALLVLWPPSEIGRVFRGGEDRSFDAIEGVDARIESATPASHPNKRVLRIASPDETDGSSTASTAPVPPSAARPATSSPAEPTPPPASDRA